MKLDLATPAVPPAVAAVRLYMSLYNFLDDSITITWLELDASGNTLRERTQTLTPAQVAAFFATPVAGSPDLRTTFVQAFIAAVTSLYAQSVTLVGT